MTKPSRPNASWIRVEPDVPSMERDYGDFDVPLPISDYRNARKLTKKQIKKIMLNQRVVDRRWGTNRFFFERREELKLLRIIDAPRYIAWPSDADSRQSREETFMAWLCTDSRQDAWSTFRERFYTEIRYNKERCALELVICVENGNSLNGEYESIRWRACFEFDDAWLTYFEGPARNALAVASTRAYEDYLEARERAFRAAWEDTFFRDDPSQPSFR